MCQQLRGAGEMIGVQIRDRHLHAGLQKPLGGRKADPRCAAGDDGDLILGDGGMRHGGLLDAMAMPGR